MTAIREVLENDDLKELVQEYCSENTLHPGEFTAWMFIEEMQRIGREIKRTQAQNLLNEMVRLGKVGKRFAKLSGLRTAIYLRKKAK